MLPELIAAVVAMSAVIGVGVYRTRIAADPSRWPKDASLATQVKLAKRFVRGQGWTLGESLPWMNVFVRANKGNTWLALMIHGPETLGLPLLMRDCIDKAAGTAFIMGILTRERLPEHLKADAERSGIYVINPTDLADVESHILRAAARQRALREAATAPAARGAVATRVAAR